MGMIETSYGKLSGVMGAGFYKSGSLRECMLEEMNIIKTTFGDLIPKHQVSESRDKQRSCLEFFESGILKSIYLETQTMIQTTVGQVPAEMLTFYEDGNIHRIFPLYGQVSGFWSEEEETKRASSISLQIADLKITQKISCINFYQMGSVKSLTFFPGETMLLQKNGVKYQVRLGISFYEDGKIKSLEPGRNSVVNTRIGKIIAFDNNPIGVHGDQNSLQFDKAGEVIKVTTGATLINLLGHNRKGIQIKAGMRQSPMDIEKQVLVPITVVIEREKVGITDSDKHQIFFPFDEYKIKAEYNTEYQFENECSDCSSCTGCSH